MLRTYKPLVSHTVFAYQILIEHLISNVWCNAEEGVDCISLLSADFEIIYSSREWVKDSVDSIYELCKLLTPDERAEIREAFVINNCINDFCEATKKPIELSQLPKVVTDLMKDFLIKCYSNLISAKEKLDYYNELIKKNQSIKFCPCCGLLPIESPESKYREDNDHYLPKAEYPFASVNFDNLPPLCSKCNKKCKSTKNPFENGRKSFYPFKPLDNDFKITLSIKNKDDTDFLQLKQNEIDLSFNNDVNKVNTWDWLFNIKTRYNEEIRQFSKTELRTLASRFKRCQMRNQKADYNQMLNDTIEDYTIDKYDDRKFLKLAFLREMLNKPEWLAVYF
jgi:hypothetical protein